MVQHFPFSKHLSINYYAPMKPVLFALLLLAQSNLLAQNLVYNPSFEEFKPNAIVVACEFMQYSVFFGERMRFWDTYEGMTPDILQAAENCPWLTKAHSGTHCIGLINYLPAADVDGREDYHEQVRGRLMRPLIPGQHYRVECWVREDSSIIREHLAKVYTPKTPVVPTKAGNLGFYFYVKNARYEKQPQVNFSEVIETNGDWIKLSGSFVPDEPFEYFIMGNFFPDRLTAHNLSADQVQQISLKNGKTPHNVDRVKRASYICIDDVSVELVADAPSLEKTLLVERKFTFNAAVLFETAKAELQPNAGMALDSLVAFMLKHPKVRLGISGHTDSDGTEEYNLDLSERRAKAVQQYLVDRGVLSERLRFKGFGESYPVADNLTEAGKQANRRVECVVLKTKED